MTFLHFGSVWLCQQRSWYGDLSVVVVRRSVLPSFCHPINIQLWSNYPRTYIATGQISFKFQLLLALGHTPRCYFAFLEKKRLISILSRFFFVSLTWDPMEAKTSKRYSSLKSLWIFSQTSPKFSCQLSSQNYCFGFLIFFLLYDFSRFFFCVYSNIESYGRKSVKRYSSLRSLLGFFIFFWIFSSLGLALSTVLELILTIV